MPKSIAQKNKRAKKHIPVGSIHMVMETNLHTICNQHPHVLCLSCPWYIIWVGQSMCMQLIKQLHVEY